MKVGMFAKYKLMMSTTNNKYSLLTSADNGPESISSKIFDLALYYIGKDSYSDLLSRVLAIIYLITMFLFWCAAAFFFNFTRFTRGIISEWDYLVVTVFYSISAALFILLLATAISVETGRAIDLLVVSALFFMLFSLSNHLLIAIFVFKGPITLTNAFMHALNGNISEARIQIIDIILEMEFSYETFRDLALNLCDEIEEAEDDFEYKPYRLFDIALWRIIKYEENTDYSPNDLHKFFLSMECLFNHSTLTDMALVTKNTWKDYMLSNKGMHSLNGNIHPENVIAIARILSTPLTFERMILTITCLLDGEMTPYESTHYAFKLFQCFNAFGIDDGFCSFAIEWQRAIEFCIADFESWPNDPEYRYSFPKDPSIWFIGSRLRHAWVDFMNTNAGAHALNGNGNPSPQHSPQRRSNRMVYTPPQKRTKLFQDWFVLNEGETNLCTLVNAWCKKLERQFRLIREESGECTDFAAISRAVLEFSEFRSTLHPYTINRVEEYLLNYKVQAQAQMGLFSVDLNVKHSVPSVENFGNSLYNSLPNDAKFLNAESLNFLNDACFEPFLWTLLSLIIYGISAHYSEVPLSFKKIVLTLIPFSFMFSMIRETTGLLEQLSTFRTLLASKVDFDAQMESMSGFNAQPQMQTETLIDVSGLLYGALSYKLFGLKTPESALKQVSAFWHARPAIEDAIIKLSSLVESVVNEILIENTTYSPVRFLSSRSSLFTQFESECDSLIAAYNRSELVPTADLYHSVKALEVRMKVEYSKMTKDKSLVGSARLFYAELQKIEAIRVYVERKTGASLSLRQEPVVVMFHGEPGTGKSLTTQYLAYDAAMLDSSEEEKEVLRREPKAFQFDRLPDPFWTGYQPDTKVCIKDDFDQVRDVVGIANSEFMEFIRCGSSATYVLNMAHLEEKGNVYFRSKFLLCNTNSGKFSVESIRNAEAVNRRVDINMMVVPRPMFCTPKTKNLSVKGKRMDYTLLPKNEDGVTILSPESQDFFYTDTSGKVSINEPLTYADVLDKVKEVYEKKKAWHKCQLEEMVNRTSRKNFDELAASQFGEHLNDAKTFLEDGDESVRDFINCASHTAFNSCHPNPTIALANLYEAYTEPFVSELYSDYVETGYVPSLPSPMVELDLLEPRRFSFKETLSNAVKESIKFLKSGSEYFMKLVNFIYSSRYVSILSLMATFLGAYGVYKYFSSESYEPQSFGMGDKGGKNQKKAKFVGKDFRSLYPAQPQLGDGRDPSGGDLLRSICRKNAFVVYYESSFDSGKFIKAGMALAVKGRFVLMPYHFLTKFASMMQSDDSFGLARIRFQVYAASGYILEFRLCDLLSSFALHGKDPQIPGKDLCVFEMPPDFQPRSDITKNFALRKDNSQFQKNIPFKLIAHCGDPESFGGFASALDYSVDVPCSWSDSWTVREGYSYKVATNVGDCGSIFCVLNPGIQGRKIFGMHVAGHVESQVGFSESICQEEILSKLDELGEVVPSPISKLDFVVPQLGTFESPSHFNVVGKLEKGIPCSSGVSDLKRSLLFDCVSQHTCLPAHLRPFVDKNGDTIDPMAKAKAKMGVNIASLPHDLIKRVVEHVFCHFENVSKKDVERKIFNEEEILYGIVGESSVRGINTSTSPGYPEVLLPKPKRLKFRIFQHEKDSEPNLKARKEFQSRLDHIDHLLRVGERPVFLNILTAKDEKKEIEKVEEGKTRAFQNGGFDSLATNKRYFGAFASWVTLNRIDNGITGGVNVYSDEWHFLAQKLKNASIHPNVGAGDFKAFDGSHMSIFIWYICIEINKWYDDGHDQERLILILDLMSPLILDFDLVVELSHSLPSGHFLTFLMNSVLNHCYHAMCWVLADQRLEEFYKQVYLATHGDDSIFRVSDQYVEIFNEYTLEKLMVHIGLTYTSETKGVSEVPLRFLYEVQYLKRSFVFDEVEQKFIAPMKLEAVLEPLNWSKASDYFNITVSNVDSCLRELALWDKPTFDKYHAKILTAVKSKLPEANFPRPLRLPFSSWRRVVMDSEFLI